MKYQLGSLLLLALVSSASAARILAVLPIFVRSHHIFFQGLLKALAQKGHEVVVYTPFSMENPPPNYTEIIVQTTSIEDHMNYEVLKEMLSESPTAAFCQLWKKMDHLVEDVLKHEEIKKLVKSNEKFDIVITEAIFGQEAFLVFGHIFNAPNIMLIPSDVPPIGNWVMGNSLSLSNKPDMMFEFSDQMTFYQRAINSYSVLKSIYTFHQDHIPKHQEKIQRILGLKKTPLLEDLLQNVSILFTNRHPTSMYVHPYTPNIVSLGGIHMRTERNPLQHDIKKFIDEAQNGLIYFSLGTIVPEHKMPREFYNKFINVFKTLPQRVLWKLRTNIEGLPPNVMTAQWIQQQEVLEYPNLSLFMTHGGLLSQLETTRAGVPVVAMPFFGDQPQNVGFYRQKGIGVKLDLFTLSEDKISEAINTVLADPRYKINAKRLSQVVRDVPMSPADLAMYWVEYVLRHAGAHHLRPASTRLAWYQLALLDVMAVLLLPTVFLTIVMYLIIRKLLAFLFHTSKGSKMSSSGKKNN